MRHRFIGQSGIDTSVVGLGTWAISGWMWGGTNPEESIRAIQAGLDAGINLIDTAPAYGLGLAEEIVGKAVKGRRSKVILATKFGLVWHSKHGRYRFHQDGIPVYQFLESASIRYEIEQSLKRLQTDYVDLYQIHWQDGKTPIAEIMATLLDLKREGKIRAIGVCNVSATELDAYHRSGPVDSDQEEYHMLDRDPEADSWPYCREHGIAALAYSPLAQGLLTGKLGLNRQFPEGDLRRDYERFSLDNRKKVAAFLDTLQSIANKHQISLGQLAIAWTISGGSATHALVSVRNPQQASENAGAGDVFLSEEEMGFIDAAIEGHHLNIPHLW